MSQTTNLFLEKFLKFEEGNNINNELIPIPIAPAKFGILNITGVTASASKTPFEFVFMVDRSGSMSDRCSDGRTKMQHITHTLKNMVIYFSENPDINVYVTVYVFDNEINVVLDRTIVTNSNITEIIEKIDKVHPRGSTNIEVALRKLRNSAANMLINFPENIICNIFMTDGEATSGNIDHTLLTNLVDTSVSVTNSFIGFGVDHDTVLLNALGSGFNSEYYFIDKIENAGLVYGEILHSIIYKLLINVHISVKNGIIYDFKNNIWTPELPIGGFVSEANKMYHIASSTPEECLVTLTANKSADLENVSIVIQPEETDEDEPVNLTKYIYRQRTLQHLFIVKEFLKRKNKNAKANTKLSIFTFTEDENTEEKAIMEEEKTIKQTLKVFIEEMKKYMTENNLAEDKLLKNLCDDIYICYRTFATRYGDMYVGARQTSQGTQRCYTASHTPVDIDKDNNSNNNIFPNAPTLKRHMDNGARLYFDNIPILETLGQIDDNFIDHELSGFDDAPYLTPGSAKLMRAISSSNKDNEDEEDSLYISPSSTSSCLSSPNNEKETLI